MAREQVQGLPTRGIRPANVQAGQYRVAVQQAPESQLMGLARGLSSVNRGLEAYAGIAEIHRELGEERGALEAAQADLAEAEKNLNATGQKLVDQGLMPRSHLLGFQKAYHENIGKRFLTQYQSSVNGRWKEISNPEADDEIIQRVLSEERGKINQLLESSPRALVGFTKYADAYDYQYMNKAISQRDKIVQQHNKSLIIQSLNNEFTGKLQDRDQPLNVTMAEVKAELDSLVAANSITNSEAVEILWNGFAMPTVLDLSRSNPDRAEAVLDSILDIDLTGKGGRLGNINREGAYIKARAIELRNRIDNERDRIQREAPDKSEEILQNWKSASMAVYEGLLEKDDPRYDEDLQEKGREVVRALIASGMPPNVADSTAMGLLESRDIDALMGQLRSGYTRNESTRGAFLDALPSMNGFTKQTVDQGIYVATEQERVSFVDEYTDLLKSNPDVSALAFARQYSILDGRLRDELIEVEKAHDNKTWYVRSETHEDNKSAIKSELKSVLTQMYEQQVDIYYLTQAEQQIAYLTDDIVNEFERQYEENMLDASQGVADRDPNSMQDAHRRQFEEVRQKYRQRVLDEAAGLKASIEKQQVLKAQRQSYDKKKIEIEKDFTKLARDIMQETVEVRKSVGLLDPGQYTIAATELGEAYNTFKSERTRDSAIRYLDHLRAFEKQGKIPNVAKEAYEKHVNAVRSVYGFSVPEEVPEGFVSEYGRSVLFFKGHEIYMKFYQMVGDEFERYSGGSLDNFPNLRLLQNKLLVLPKEDDINQFFKNQELLAKEMGVE